MNSRFNRVIEPEMEKLARSIFAPFSVEEDEYNSPRGMAKEEANRAVGRNLGRVIGGSGGGAMGMAVARSMGARPSTIGKLLRINPAISPLISSLLSKKINPKLIAGGLMGLGAGAVVGDVAGDYKSIKDTKRGANVDSADFEDFVVRRLKGKDLVNKEMLSEYLLTRGQ